MAAAWWQKGIVYQVYPRSLQDSDGDGTGDLRGIMGRLEAIRDLGVDAVWLSPIYPSPMTDFGYDVSDYCGIDPLFGTMADFDALLARVHGLGLKLILDFVPNHSSDQHPWFQASRAADGRVGRLVSVAGSAEQLDGQFRGERLDVGRAAGAVLLPLVPADAAGSELAQSGSQARDVRRAAVLVG